MAGCLARPPGCPAVRTPGSRTCSRMVLDVRAQARSPQGSAVSTRQEQQEEASAAAATGFLPSTAAPPPIPPATRKVAKREPVTLAMLSDVHSMFSSLLDEYAYWVDEANVEGTIPPELCGTYYRNGPGLQLATGSQYNRHTLDGDGMLFSLAFKDGRAYFRNRFVRTKGFLEEQAAGKPLHRNSFTRGSADGSFFWNPFDLFGFKNVANTGVLPWGGQLYALWEGGLPYLMDPTTLDTLRETRMGGQIKASTFSAHYRIVHPHPQQQQQQKAQAQLPEAAGATASSSSAPQAERASSGAAASTSGHAGAGAAAPGSAAWRQGQRLEKQHGKRLVTFSNEFSFQGAKAVFYEFDEAGKLLHEVEHMLEGITVAVIHDMVVTEHYYVLVVGPIRLDPVKFTSEYMLGRCSIAESILFDPKSPTKIMLFPRPGRPSGLDLQPRVLYTSPLFVFHNVNGWELTEQQERDTLAAGGGSLPPTFSHYPSAPHSPESVVAAQQGRAAAGGAMPSAHATSASAAAGPSRTAGSHPAAPSKLVIDTVAWDEVSFTMELFDKDSSNLDTFYGGARTQLTRLVCDLHTGAVTRQQLVQRTVEFPATDPRVVSRPHAVSWFLADEVDDPVQWGPATCLIRVETDPRVGLGAQGWPGLARSTHQLEQRATSTSAVAPTIHSYTNGTAHGTVPAASAPRMPANAGLGAPKLPTLSSFKQPRRAQPHTVSNNIVPRTPAPCDPPTAAAPCAPPCSSGLAPPSRCPTAERGLVPGVSVDVYDLGARTFPGEPMFVPRPGSDREGDGWVIVGCYNAATEKAEVHIFDADQVSKGPVATLHLPHRLPVSLHGAWLPTYLGPDPNDPSVPPFQHLGSARPL